MAETLGILPRPIKSNEQSQMNRLPELDVVIVNYNSGQALQQCVDFLLQGSEINLNVFVVDNHSEDDSLTFMGRMEHPIDLIKNNDNLGFSVACNQGSESGHAPQIAFINPDCFINQQQLLQLSAQLSDNQSGGLIGCRVLNEDGTLQAASRRRLPTFWRILWHLSALSKFPLFKGININDSGEFDSLQQVEAVNGACIVIKRKIFEQLGGFDEAFPLHFEDLDLFARLQANQHAVLYDSSVIVKHLKGHSVQDSQLIKSWKKQGLLRYLLKHRPKWEYGMAKFWLGSK